MIRIAVIGGGAAGLMAAAAIIEKNTTASIVLCERNNELGKKVRISGGGRCNVTTGILDMETIFSKYPRGGKFLQSAMRRFSPSAMMEWVEAHGVPLKIEDDLRVFPVSNESDDVVRIFEKLLREHGADVRLNTSVTRISHKRNIFSIRMKNSDEIIEVDRVVITTGGQAYRQTGSTGDGYAFAHELGHHITSLAPSLSSFITLQKWPAEISGVSFTWAELSLRNSKAKFQGPFLFTHKGISGPAVFALSSQIAFEPCDQQHPLSIEIDLFPDTSLDALMKQFVSLVQSHPKKSVQNLLATMIPKSLADVLCMNNGIDSKRHAIEYSKKQIEEILGRVKQLELQVIGRGAGDEFVTAGGIELSEVNPKTMESKICPGLFFAGEVLDIDGYTGGFNLQASWCTGRIAGEYASREPDI